jgi:hypothetical protein
MTVRVTMANQKWIKAHNMIFIHSHQMIPSLIHLTGKQVLISPSDFIFEKSSIMVIHSCIGILPIAYSFNSVAYAWVHGAKTTGPIPKNVCLFLNQIFSAVINFKFRHMLCCVKSCKIKFSTILAFYHLVLGQFQWNFQLYLFMSIYRCFIEKVSLKNIQK